MTEDEVKKASESLSQDKIKELNDNTRERVAAAVSAFKKSVRSLTT